PNPTETCLKSVSNSIKELKAALHAQLNRNYPFNPRSPAFENTPIALSTLEKYYTEGDPVALIEAFILSVTNFDFAPQWVLERLREKFSHWHIAVLDGPSKSMDECLGIGSQQNKRSTPVDKHKGLNRDGKFCYEMHCL
ncbi:MAG: hypothetical protein M3Q07_07555, partial [Pseudobdellovibrionaceae bacterium]|nr:hypothetical protein [Pseudobdellovibrionaceae bacterium]